MGGGGCGWQFGLWCGVDLCYDFEIMFEDVFYGKVIEVSVEVLIGCDFCGGLGVKFGIMVWQCSICGGYGKVCV